MVTSLALLQGEKIGWTEYINDVRCIEYEFLYSNIGMTQIICSPRIEMSLRLRLCCSFGDLSCDPYVHHL